MLITWLLMFILLPLNLAVGLAMKGDDDDDDDDEEEEATAEVEGKQAEAAKNATEASIAADANL